MRKPMALALSAVLVAGLLAFGWLWSSRTSEVLVEVENRSGAAIDEIRLGTDGELRVFPGVAPGQSALIPVQVGPGNKIELALDPAGARVEADVAPGQRLWVRLLERGAVQVQIRKVPGAVKH